MRIEVNAKLILTVPEPPEVEEGKPIVEDIILAAEQYINEFSYFIIPVSESEAELELEATLRGFIREALSECRKEITAAGLGITCTKVGIRIHVDGKGGKVIR